MRYSLVILFTLALAFSVDAQSQKPKSKIVDKIEKMDSRTISGEVVDENGDPLAGATVMLKGTDIGVATNVDGQFSLMVSGNRPVLEVSYIGMTPQTISISKDIKYLFLTMKTADNMMDEVVVTGYQNIKRESATGSYQVLTAKDLDKRSTPDLASRLEGTVPGLVMDPKKGSTDEDAFTIRGVGDRKSVV